MASTFLHRRLYLQSPLVKLPIFFTKKYNFRLLNQRSCQHDQHGKQDLYYPDIFRNCNRIQSLAGESGKPAYGESDKRDN